MLIIGSCLCLFPNFQRTSPAGFCRENGKSIILKLALSIYIEFYFIDFT